MTSQIDGIRVWLEATPGSGLSIGLAFLVAADVAQDIALWAPVIPYQLRAFVDGAEVALARPALDLPAAQKRYRAGPGPAVRIPCPVLLLFGADGSQGNGLNWTIRCVPPPAVVELEAGLELDGGVVLAPRVTVRLAG